MGIKNAIGKIFGSSRARSAQTGQPQAEPLVQAAAALDKALASYSIGAASAGMLGGYGSGYITIGGSSSVGFGPGYDTHSAYNEATDTFTAPVSGRYRYTKGKGANQTATDVILQKGETLVGINSAALKEHALTRQQLELATDEDLRNEYNKRFSRLGKALQEDE